MESIGTILPTASCYSTPTTDIFYSPVKEMPYVSQGIIVLSKWGDNTFKDLPLFLMTMMETAHLYM